MHGISHQLLCFHQHQDFLFAARNCNTLLQFMQHAITVAVYTVCNTPAVVFGANRTIMRSLLDLRQLRLSASCLCKSSLLHLFKICEFMKYDSINLILRQSLKSLISGSSTEEILMRLLHLFQLFCLHKAACTSLQKAACFKH